MEYVATCLKDGQVVVGVDLVSVLRLGLRGGSEYHYALPCPECGALITRKTTPEVFERLRAEGAVWSELNLSSHPAGSDL